MKQYAPTARLIRFVAMRMLNGHRTDDGIVLDAFVSERGVICAGVETFGYRATHIGRGDQKYDLLKLTSKLEVEEFENVNDAGRILQKRQRWSIPADTRIEVGGLFVDGGDLEDEPPLEILEVVAIASTDAKRIQSTNIWEAQLADDFRHLTNEDQIAVLRHAASLRQVGTLGGTVT